MWVLQGFYKDARGPGGAGFRFEGSGIRMLEGLNPE